MGVLYNEMHARLYGHLANTFNWLQVAAGSAAFFAAIKDLPALGIAAGLLVAFIGAVGVVVDPSGRAARFDVHTRRFGALDEIAETLPSAELDARLTALQRDHQPGQIAALEQPAYNATLVQNGRADAMVPIGRWDRAIAALA